MRIKTKKENTLDVFEAMLAMFKDLKDSEVKQPQLNALGTLISSLGITGGVYVKKDKNGKDEFIKWGKIRK